MRCFYRLWPLNLSGFITRPGGLTSSFLDMVDRRPFERIHKRNVGQPPIHPLAIVGVIIYGTRVRIHSSLTLEDALRFRSDFVWIARNYGAGQTDNTRVSGQTLSHHSHWRRSRLS